jgi:diaminopimelate decarboxylase
MCRLITIIQGKFTMSMMHDWVGTALPEVPPRAQEAERTLYFVNVFTDTELSVTYKKGHAVFKADSTSTIAILRDVVSSKARDLRIDINMDKCNLSPTALIRTLQKLDPKVSG